MMEKLELAMDPSYTLLETVVHKINKNALCNVP